MRHLSLVPTPWRKSVKFVMEFCFCQSDCEVSWMSHFDCVVDLLGVMVGRASHQTDDEMLKFARQLILQILDQVLM